MEPIKTKTQNQMRKVL